MKTEMIDEELNVEELMRKRAELDGQIKRALRATRDADLAKCKALIERHDFAPAELGFECGQSCASGAEIKAPAVVAITPPAPAKPKLPPKFRNPETGDTWTGRGLKPKWLEQALAEGRLLSDFLVDAPAQEPAHESTEPKAETTTEDASGEPAATDGDAGATEQGEIA
jgi:DNA-binding protein H-NS